MDAFFATGYQKSGTTFLQQVLDAHPSVSCPPEHHLNTLMNALQSVLQGYRAVIAQIDERTAQQGLRFTESHVLHHMLRGAVQGLLTDSIAPGTKKVGLNDNSLWQSLPVFAALFPKARFIGVIRDPRAVTVSLYRHRQRTEPDFEATGLTMAKLAPIVAKSWSACIDSFETFAAKPGHAARLKLVRYEDLAGPDQATHLSALYAFLGLDPAPDLVAAALAMHDFQKQKARSGGFLHAGPAQTWTTELDPGDVAVITEMTEPALTRYGYGPASG